MAFENSGVPAFTQAGSFSAEQTRRAVFACYARTSANSPGILSGGLISSADLQLSNAVSGLVVYVSTGEAIVPGNEGGAEGGFYARNTSQISLTLATANASNPRIDLICLTVDDTGYTPPSGGTSGQVTAQAVTGSPTSGATLSNLSGVGSLPGSSLLLGYVLVPAAATNLTSGDILNVATIVRTGPDNTAWTTLSVTIGTAGTPVPQAKKLGGVVYLRGQVVVTSGGFNVVLPDATWRPSAVEVCFTIAEANPNTGPGGAANAYAFSTGNNVGTTGAFTGSTTWALDSGFWPLG